MKKGLIAIAVLLVAAQTQTGPRVQKAVQKVGTYPVNVRNISNEPYKVTITPRYKLPKCEPVTVRVQAKRGMRVQMPRRCCLSGITVQKGKKTVANARFRGNCVVGSTLYKISKGPKGSVQISQTRKDK